MIIVWIALLEADGQIQQLNNVPGGPRPVDGDTTEDGLLIKHVLQQDLDDLGIDLPGDLFHDRYWWKNDTWTFKGIRPNMYYNFNSSTESWERLDSMIVQKIRWERNNKLAQTDFTQIGDAPFTDQQKASYIVYRQALRDVPENIPADLDDPDDFVWPVL